LYLRRIHGQEFVEMNRAEKFERLTSTRGVRQDLGRRSARAAVLTGTVGFADFAIRIGSTAVLARLILPEHFGLVMMASAVIAVADQLRDLGLSSATVQRLEVTDAEVSNLFWINVGCGALITGGIAAVSPLIARYYHDPRLVAVACILGSTIFFGGLTVQHQALLTRQLKLGQTATVRLLSSLISTLIAIAMAWLDYGYWALLWREIIRAVLLVVGMWWCCPWLPGWPAWKTNVRELVNFGANVTGANILATITAGVDRLLLGRSWGAGPVALYRQAFQLVTAPTDQLLSPLYLVTQPTLSMLQTEPARYQRFFLKLLTLVCMITMPLSLFVAVYADAITAIMLGPAWMASAPILCVLSFGTFLRQASYSTSFILITRGDSATYLRLTVLHNIILAVTMFIGVRWGVLGIAGAEVLTTYLLVLPRLYYTLPGSPVSTAAFLAGMARPVVASVAMSYALIALRAFIPDTSITEQLVVGIPTALIVFFNVWLLLPGGKSELMTVFTDVRSALQRKKEPVAPLEEAATAN
jgi:O-antigen/teichoic acid export membrane protein